MNERGAGYDIFPAGLWPPVVRLLLAAQSDQAAVRLARQAPIALITSTNANSCLNQTSGCFVLLAPHGADRPLPGP